MTIDFAAIEARAEAAHPLPWEARRWASQEHFADIVAGDRQIIDMLSLADAEFVVHAREDIPALLGDRLRAVTRLRELEQDARVELEQQTRPATYAPTPELIALEARVAAFNAAVDVVLGVIV